MLRLRVPFIVLALAACLAPAWGGDALEAELEAKLAERHRRALALAQLYYASGDWRRAADHYEAARRIRDDDVQVLTQLTRLYATHRDDRRLLSTLEALVRLQPKSVGWLRELGSCLYRLGRHDEAEATWHQILEVYPNHSSALRYLAQVYDEHGLHDKAIAVWRRAVEAGPGDEHLHLQLAEALSKAKRHLEALAACTPLDTAPTSSSSRRTRAVVNAAYFELDLPRPARAACEARLRVARSTPADFAWAIAEALEQAGEAKRAADFYRRVAALEPEAGRGKAAAAKAKALAPGPEP